MSTTIADLLVKIGVSVDGAKNAQKEVEGSTKASEDTDTKGSPKLKAFAKVAKAAFGGVAVAATAASGAVLAAGGVIFGFVSKTTQDMDDIAKGFKKAGLASSEEFQRISHAAKLSGTEVGGVAKGLKALNVQMLDASRGGGAAFKQSLTDVGLGLADLEGKSATEQLGIIADALNKVEDESMRSVLASKLLGKSGSEMADLLRAGSRGINEMAGSLENVFTDDQLSQAEEFQNQLTNVKAQLGQAAGELAIALTPAIEAGVKVFQDFIRENDELIKQQLPRLLTMVAENAVKLLPIALKVVGVIADLVEEATPLVDRFLIFTTGQLERGLNGTKSALSVLLPIVLKLANAVLDTVEGIEKAYNWAVTLGSIEKNQVPRGAPGFLGDKKDPKTGETPNEVRAREAKEKKSKQDEVTKARAAEEAALVTRKVRIVSDKLASSTKGGRKWSDADEALASMHGLTRDDIRNAAGTTAPKRGGGGRAKPVDAPTKSASFGDFRDVLAVYMGRSPEEAMQGLSTLEQGKMREDHRPETSINITNNTTNNYDVTIPVNGARNAQETAIAVRDVLAATYKDAAAKMPQNIVR